MGTNTLGSRQFVYDSAGNLSRYTDPNGAVRQYQYDSAGNPTTETWYATAEDAENAENPLDTIQYTRDSAGRITSESDNSSSDTYSSTTPARLSARPRRPLAGRP